MGNAQSLVLSVMLLSFSAAKSHCLLVAAVLPLYLGAQERSGKWVFGHCNLYYYYYYIFECTHAADKTSTRDCSP